MANYFLDNEDIQDYFNNVDLRRMVELRERLFEEAKEYDYAPENYEDAIDNYRRVLTIVGELAAENFAERAAEVDTEGTHFDSGKVTYATGIQQDLDDLVKAELMGFTLPRRFNGLNCPVLVYTMATELVSQADASLMNIFGLQDISETINSFADEELKQKYLPMFCEGKVTGAMVLTEPDAGSDLTNVQLKAIYDERADAWYLDGVKRFITNGCAQVLLVLARSEPDMQGARGLSLFICEADPKTTRIRRIEDKLGIHGSPTCEIQFDRARAYLVGTRKRGLTTYVLSLMNGARLAIAAQGVGLAQAAYQEALDYARTREQFGSPICQFPQLREKLGEMHAKVETARLLTYETARAVDLSEEIERAAKSGLLDKIPDGDSLRRSKKAKSRLASALTPLAKMYATEVANQVAYDAIQVMGGSGYMRDYNLERYFRDARIMPIYEGTTEIQVNAAIGSILNGSIENHFEELHKQHEGQQTKILERAKEARRLLQEAVDYVKGLDDRQYIDLHARRLVDSAIDILNTYLLLATAQRSVHKEVLAEKYAVDMLPRVRMRHEMVLSGDRTYLDRTVDLMDYT